MTDEFLTKGLQNDRYLKALRLAEQFEDEIEAVLREFDREMVKQQPEMFDSSTEPSYKHNRTPSNGLAIHRINHAMNGPRAPDDDLRLNVHLYWMPPTEYGLRNIDGALRAFGYKIKYADTDIDEKVVTQTKTGDWSIKTAGNPYDSNKVFYNHVSSVAELEETKQTLIEHFSEFGDAYSIDQADQF